MLLCHKRKKIQKQRTHESGILFYICSDKKVFSERKKVVFSFFLGCLETESACFVPCENV
jgi:hypothetical protein